MKTFAQKVIALGVGMFLSASVAVYGDILYENTTIDTGNSLTFTNGWQIGNEIVMGNGYTAASLTNFSFEIYSTLAAFTGANVQMDVWLYSNNGTPPFNGFPTPNSVLYHSGLFTLQTPQQYSGINAVALNFDLTASPITILTTNFTFAAVVTGLAPGDIVGMELFTNVTVGQNYGDYWVNSGGGWALQTNSVATGIGARFEGNAAPEPSTLSLCAVGLAVGAFWLRRRQHQARQN
jgi:hypothetical protein